MIRHLLDPEVNAARCSTNLVLNLKWTLSDILYVLQYMQ